MKRSSGAAIPVLVGVVIGLLVWGAFSAYQIEKMARTKPVVYAVKSEVLTGMQINAKIFQMMQEGNIEKVYKFYDNITHDRKITFVLVSDSLAFNIPTNILVGLGMTENPDQDVNVVNSRNNFDGKPDVGYLQIHAAFRPDKTVQWLMILENNVLTACQKMIEGYTLYKDWYKAIICYNGGSQSLVDGLKLITINHFVATIENERLLDIAFNKEL